MEKKAEPITTRKQRRQQVQRVPVQADTQDGAEDQHDDHLAHGADARREGFAGHQGRAGRGCGQQLGEHTGVALPDDLDAIEDGDEQGGLGHDARRQVVQVRQIAGRDGAQTVEGLAVDQQPERGLDGAGIELGAIMADLTQLDPAEGDQPVDKDTPGRRNGGGAPNQAGARCGV